MAELREESREEGLQQGLQQGTEIGERQATLRLINNLLQVRFGEIEEELAAIVEAIASLPSEEFTPLLFHLSREKLLAKFASEQKQEK